MLLSLANHIESAHSIDDHSQPSTHSQLCDWFMPTTNRRPPSFYNLLFLNILYRLLCYWLGRNRSAPISTYISHLKTLLLIADGNPRSSQYRINGLVPLPLSNTSSYIITRDPRKRKDNIITQRQNFRAAIGFYAVIPETHLPTLRSTVVAF